MGSLRAIFIACCLLLAVFSSSPALAEVSSITAGTYNSLALKADGGVVAWGAGVNGLQAYPDYGQSIIPLEATSGIIGVASGFLHTVVLKSNGTVTAWGAGDASHSGATDGFDFGQSVVPAGLTDIIAVGAGSYYSAALRSNGTVTIWGDMTYFSAALPAMASTGSISAIAAGGSHLVALLSNGTITAWGNNASTQLIPPAEASSGVIAIAAGLDHTVCLKNDNTVWAWGSNTDTQSTVPPGAATDAIAIAAGGFHNLALKSNGSVTAWGRNGLGQSSPPAEAASGVVAVAAGGYHSLALKNDGSIITWGANVYGQATVPYYTVTIGSLTGTAGGPVQITSNEGGINCTWNNSSQSGTCVSSNILRTTRIVLTASLPHSRITSWGAGCDSSTATTCTINLASNVTIAPTVEANNPPVFPIAPTVTGTALVGQTLGLANATATDPDGDTLTYTYQWHADSVSIPGATASTYVIAQTDAHKTIDCTVSANDAHGGITPATTVGVLVGNTAPAFSGVPAISGTAAVGNTLSLSNTGTTDADGDTITLSYQWKANGTDIGGATAATYVPTSAVAHQTITCTLTASDGHSGTAGPVTTAGVAMSNTAPAFSSTPTITGTVAVGSTLSLINTGTTDADGDTVTLAYQWKANGADIGGATAATYVPTSAFAHQTITCTITAGDGHGGTTPYTTAGAAMNNTAPTFSSTPTISGTAAVGNTLSLINTGTTDADGDTVTLAYQWKANGADIGGATAATYVPTSAVAHQSITCTITASDGHGGSTPYTTAGAAMNNTAPTFSSTPTISGTAAVGNTLSLINTGTTDADGDTVTLGYQWKSGGVDIAGATAATYVPTSSVAHTNITCTITASDGHGGSPSTTTAGLAMNNTAPAFSSTPTITGTAAVGSTLSLINTGTTDADGDTVTLSYQWKANGSDIVGATAATYVPTSAVAHQPITCTVSASDGHGGAAVPVTTAGVAMNNTAPAFTATPTISGTAAVGNTLSLINTGTTDADGDTVTLSYQWKANGADIGGATAATYVPTSAFAHQTITCTLTASDAHGGSTPVTTAGASMNNTAPTFSSTPTISGTAAAGNTLSLINTGTTDADGDTVTLSYQWKTNGANITGATSATYVPTSAVAHTTITCTITASDAHGGTPSATTAGVAMINTSPVFTGTPIITGTAAVGNTLSLLNTSTSDADGDTVTLSYQWKSDGANISGATSATYVLTSAETGKTITCTISASDGHGGTAGPVTTTGSVVGNTPPAFTGTPTISGTPAVGNTLSLGSTGTTDADGDTVTLTYQWNAAGAPISGATASTYVPTAAVAHQTITCTIIAGDGRGGNTPFTTAGLALNNTAPTFSTPGAMAISGTAAVGNTLSLINTGTSDIDGDTVTLGYQWKASGNNIAGATSSTYVPTAAVAGQTITCTVTATDGHGGSAVPVTTSSIPWNNTAPAFTGTPAITGTAAVGNTLSLSNTGTTDADGNTVTLSYQWKANGTNINGATAATYVLTSAVAHQTITCTITANDGQGGSTPVTTVGASMSNTAPTFSGTPTITGTAEMRKILSLINTGTSDADGDTVTLSYQWKADGVNITGATSATYLLTSAEAGKSITCAMTANDGHGGVAGPVTTVAVAVISEIFGDMDGNGTVDSVDALKVLRIAAKIDTPTALDLEHGDVAPLVNGARNPDGKIDLSDVIVILRKSAGLLSW